MVLSFVRLLRTARARFNGVLSLGIRRAVLVYEPAVGVGAHHVDVGAGGQVGARA
jgi:hypothetical protein